MATPRRCRSRHAGTSTRASAVVPGRGPAVTAAGRVPSNVVVIDNDDDDVPRSGFGAVPRRSLPTPHAGCASILCCRVLLWLPAGISLPALDSWGPAEMAGVVLCGNWAEQEGRCLHLPCHSCIKKLNANLLVVCEEDQRHPDRCTECRVDGRDCILVGLLLASISLHCLW